MTIKARNCPVFLYYFGDHDPSGVDISRHVEQEIRRYAPDADIQFERVAVTPEQIDDWELPTRPTKTTDLRCKNFDGESVEVDAIHPDTLRTLAHNSIVEHIDVERYEQLMTVEQAERETLESIAKKYVG